MAVLRKAHSHSDLHIIKKINNVKDDPRIKTYSNFFQVLPSAYEVLTRKNVT